LEGVEEVEIRKEKGRIVVLPLVLAENQDPIFKLGEHPVQCGLSDAARQHDTYLYGSE
jgi:hypothetical protein